MMTMRQPLPLTYSHKKGRPLVPDGPTIPGFGSNPGYGRVGVVKNPSQQLNLSTYNGCSLRLQESPKILGITNASFQSNMEPRHGT